MANDTVYGESFSVVTADGRTIDRAQFDREQMAAAAKKDLLAMKVAAERRSALAEEKVQQLQKLLDNQAEARTK